VAVCRNALEKCGSRCVGSRWRARVGGKGRLSSEYDRRYMAVDARYPAGDVVEWRRPEAAVVMRRRRPAQRRHVRRVGVGVRVRVCREMKVIVRRKAASGRCRRQSALGDARRQVPGVGAINR